MLEHVIQDLQDNQDGGQRLMLYLDMHRCQQHLFKPLCMIVSVCAGHAATAERAGARHGQDAQEARSHKESARHSDWISTLSISWFTVVAHECPCVQVMPLLRSMLEHAKDKTHKMLRAKALASTCPYFCACRRSHRYSFRHLAVQKKIHVCR